MNGAVIRQATPDDVTRIAAIARAAYAKYIPRMGREPSTVRADFAGEVAAGRIVVIEVAGTVQGYLLAWPKDDAYWVDNVAVDPACQGQGLGHQLMNRAAAEAKDHQLPAVRLCTNIAFSETFEFYSRMGFVETHRAPEPGRYLIHMVLQLDPLGSES